MGRGLAFAWRADANAEPPTLRKDRAASLGVSLPFHHRQRPIFVSNHLDFLPGKFCRSLVDFGVVRMVNSYALHLGFIDELLGR
jgi:hypothetical protein